MNSLDKLIFLFFRFKNISKLHHALLLDLPSTTDLKALDLVCAEQFQHGIFVNLEQLLELFDNHYLLIKYIASIAFSLSLLLSSVLPVAFV